MYMYIDIGLQQKVTYSVYTCTCTCTIMYKTSIHVYALCNVYI